MATNTSSPAGPISHRYEFSPKALVARLAVTLLPFTLFVLAMQLGSRWRLLPSPRPILDTDRTILLHQAEASARTYDANVVLIGDSSCLMDVSAEQLQSLLPKAFRALNLGTLSYLGWYDYAMLLRRYVEANPGQVKAVLLLMHPEALRRSSPIEYHVGLVRSFYEERDFADPAASRLVVWSGAEMFQSRILGRILPQPLSGAYGWHYGFNVDLWNTLSANRGSAIDPRTFDPSTAKGNAEYALAAKLESWSQVFREAVPPGAKLFVGITPAPSSFVMPQYERTQEQMLSKWAVWLKADAALTDLPATFAPDHFASVTHLNAEGRARYTVLLAEALRNVLP